MISGSLSPQEFKAKLQTGDFVLIDVRTPAEFSGGHLPGAELIDMYSPDFSQKIQALDRQKKYLIYCRSGARSKAALGFMDQLGFSEAYDLDRGILAWD